MGRRRRTAAHRAPGFRRADRVAGEVRAALVEVLQAGGVHDPRVTAVTLTAVRVSDDLRHAWIDFVPLGGEGDAAAILEGLEAASGFLRRQIGLRLRLKVLPALHFSVDERIDDAVRLAALLERMEEQRGEDG